MPQDLSAAEMSSLPIVIGVFGLGLHWILDHELKRPISLDAPVLKSEDKLSHDDVNLL
jgi:hypothetical protein